MLVSKQASEQASERASKRASERERERERQTDRQTDRQTETDRHTESTITLITIHIRYCWGSFNTEVVFSTMDHKVHMTVLTYK